MMMGDPAMAERRKKDRKIEPFRVLLVPFLLAFVESAGATSYQVVPVPDGGAIDGRVTLAGLPPALPPLKITVDEDYCGTSLPNPVYDVGPDSALRNVEVFIRGISKGKASQKRPIVLDNVHCAFQPRVQGAIVGQQIKLVSSDGILHTTHPQVAATDATLYNVALPYKGFTLTRELPSSPELIHVKCDAHDWMHAWIWEFDHPYYATTDATGHFALGGVPPGTYTIVAWHELMGERQAQVTIEPGKRSTVDFSFAPRP
jgi:hypothetical protein